MKAAREEMKKSGKDMVINFDEGGKVDDYQDSLVKKFGGGMPKYGKGGMPYGNTKKD